MNFFCTSLHKTGTSSLHSFAMRAGLRARHAPSLEKWVDLEKQVAPLIGDSHAIVDALSQVIGSYDVHSDIPWPGLYHELASMYPEARFIYIERDVEQWWRSLVAHWSLNVLSRRLRPYEVVQYGAFLPDGMRLVSKSDEMLMKKAFKRHRNDVASVIPADKLLFVDLRSEFAASRLAEFMGVPAGTELRHENKRWPAWIRLVRNVNSTVKNRTKHYDEVFVQAVPVV